MARFVKGEVVVVPFPFSNLATFKKRPALVLADAGGGDYVLCQITSQHGRDPCAIKLKKADFASGSLKVDSMARPNKLFTADAAIILYSAGRLKPEKIAEVIGAAVKLLQA